MYSKCVLLQTVSKLYGQRMHNKNLRSMIVTFWVTQLNSLSFGTRRTAIKTRGSQLWDIRRKLKRCLSQKTAFLLLKQLQNYVRMLQLTVARDTSEHPCRKINKFWTKKRSAVSYIAADVSLLQWSRSQTVSAWAAQGWQQQKDVKLATGNLHATDPGCTAATTLTVTMSNVSAIWYSVIE
jgi:hypothetical protein